ncbi:hypothetical protein B296_00031319 [Ensete ventricosum]|uniref:Uncharacterized protein n=1 Tax=Ensete ventricosum TaxID=4639 RepID=A0A427AGG2_ENSVE|nr:hypothetical protein B296_00031319 [Ensete ventricosum]
MQSLSDEKDARQLRRHADARGPHLLSSFSSSTTIIRVVLSLLYICVDVDVVASDKKTIDTNVERPFCHSTIALMSTQIQSRERIAR